MQNAFLRPFTCVTRAFHNSLEIQQRLNANTDLCVRYRDVEPLSADCNLHLTYFEVERNASVPMYPYYPRDNRPENNLHYQSQHGIDNNSNTCVLFFNSPRSPTLSLLMFFKSVGDSVGLGGRGH